MRKSALTLLAFLFAFPVMANAQMYHRPYYVQRPLPEAQTLPYFLENNTGSPLKVTLLLKFPSGKKELWPFDILPNNEVYAMLPSGMVRASVKYAVASVPDGNKIKPEKVGSLVDDREDENHHVVRGWRFFRK